VLSVGEEAVQVTGDLKPGEKIVALGAHLLHEGESVRLAEPRCCPCGQTMSAKRFNLSALRCERSITLFLIILMTIAGIYAFLASGERKIRPLRSSNDGYQRLARRDRAGNAGSGCRAAGKTPAGAQMV
jgi:hypothetical protein